MSNQEAMRTMLDNFSKLNRYRLFNTSQSNAKGDPFRIVAQQHIIIQKQSIQLRKSKKAQETQADLQRSLVREIVRIREIATHVFGNQLEQIIDQLDDSFPIRTIQRAIDTLTSEIMDLDLPSKTIEDILVRKDFVVITKSDDNCNILIQRIGCKFE